MEIHVADVARMLGLSELTVTRWARQGKIPAREHQGIFLFSPRDIERWALAHNIQKSPEADPGDSTAEPVITLIRSIREGGVFFDIAGDGVRSVLGRCIAASPLPPALEPGLLLEQIMQREQMASTGIGSGVAIPHPRRPLGDLLPGPLIRVCFLRTPVDFGALDGRGVFVLFLMLSPSTKLHLHLLSRLSFCLKQDRFVGFLRTCTDPLVFLEALSGLEDALPHQAGADG